MALEGGEGVDGSRRHEEGQQRRQHGHRRQEPDADAALDAAAENGAAGPCAGHHGTLRGRGRRVRAMNTLVFAYTYTYKDIDS